MKKESKVDFKPTIMTSTMPSNNADQCHPLKHLTNNYDVHQITTPTNNERKLKTRTESYSKMNSIQETSDYDTNMKLPRFMSNYKYKQAKYLLNLTQNKYRKRKPFHFIDSTLYKTHWNYSSYYNDNETNENYTPTYRPYNYYYYYNYNNNSSHSRSAYSNIYGKRSDYGRFKRSKDSGPSLADVPMNVEFNTANPTYASNRFHVFSYEQVKQLDAIMNSCICIAPKPLFSSCIDENNPVSMNKACSCCYLQQSLMNSVKNADDLDISGLTITPLSNLSQNKKTSGEMTDTTIDATTSETPSTTPTKNTPSISSNNNLKTSTFSDHLLNEENFITHSSNSPDLSSTCYHDASVNLPSSYTPLMPGIFPTTRLPTIRIQLKKLIRTIRDRLVEESIPVKEIRLGGGAACSIVGSQKTEKFNDIDLIFRVDLSNSSTFTKIKSIVFSCITHILADTIALEKLKHYSYGCTYMCNNTLPLPPIHSPQTTPQNSLPPCCCNCTCSTLNKSFQLNKENLGSLQTTHDAPKGNNNHKNKHKHNNNNNSNSVMIESSGNRQPLHENQSNGVYQSNVITEENSCEPGTCSQNEKNSLSSSENQTEGCNYTYCSVCHPYYAYDSFLPPVACSMCSRQFSCSYYNNIDCVINNNNNNKSGNNSTSIMNPYNATIVKQYIQKMIRIFKPNSKISDSWSLFTLGYRSLSKDNETMIIDMKFIDRMHRQFEFTVDSFQIVLDSLIKFHDPTNGYLQHQKMNENFYPTVVAESLSGSYVEAVAHLNEHIIATYRPEEIHGGGLLKYCRLLAEDYKQSETTDVMSMEKYMCSRFFIDFPDIISQHNQINAFLLNQFERDSKKKANYLNILYEVVSNSTICLMTHERRQTLCLIQMFLRDVIEEEEEEVEQQQQQRLHQQQNQQKQDSKQSIVHLQEFSSNDWALDKVFYGTNYFPRHMYQVADKSELANSDEKFTTITSDKQITSTSKTTTVLKVKLKKVQEEEHDKDNNDGANNGEESDKQTDQMNNTHKDDEDPSETGLVDNGNKDDNDGTNDGGDDGVDGVDGDDDDDDDDNGSHSASIDSLSKNSSSECTCHLHYPLFHRYPPYHHHYHYHHLLNYHSQHNRHHCCHHYPHQHLIHLPPPPPPPPPHHHPVNNGDMYYYPQMVTYFPTNDYLLTPSMIKNQAYYSLPYDTTTYNNQTDNNNSAHIPPNSLPHYHAKIILPQDTKTHERCLLNHNDMRHYVGVPCTYPSMIYSKFPTDTTTTTNVTTDNGNSSNDTQMIQSRDNMLTYCEPLIFYSPTDQSYYLCPTTTSLHEVQESLPIVYNYTPI